MFDLITARVITKVIIIGITKLLDIDRCSLCVYMYCICVQMHVYVFMCISVCIYVYMSLHPGMYICAWIFVMSKYLKLYNIFINNY